MVAWKERLLAAAHGEVTRENLDPYKIAGAGVYGYVTKLDSVRSFHKGKAIPANIQTALLCGWVAFAHQVLGDAMLDADAELDPSTANFVPPVTAKQVMVLYAPVQSWIARSKSAQANPAYSIDVPLPVDLPTWIEAEPCPRAHLLALRGAAKRFAEYTEGVMTDFDAGIAPDHAAQVIAGGAAEASSAVEYAEGLWGATSGPPPAQVHQAIEDQLKSAVESYFYLGQILAKPSLASIPHLAHPNKDGDGGGSFLDAFRAAAPSRKTNGAAALGASILGGVIGGGLIGEVLGGMAGQQNQGWGGGDQGWGGGDQDWGGF